MGYKWCAVPLCKNTTIRTPNKLFVTVPKNANKRKNWLELARRNVNDIQPNSAIYFCEDHFNLPNDMINYMEYHIMGKVSQVRMKPGCMPKKFKCQEDRKKRTCSDIVRPYMLKKQRMSTIAECLNEPEQSTNSTPSSSIKDTSTSTGTGEETDGFDSKEKQKESMEPNSEHKIKEETEERPEVILGVSRTELAADVMGERDIKTEPDEDTDGTAEEKMEYYLELYPDHEIKEELVIGPEVLQVVPRTGRDADGEEINNMKLNSIETSVNPLHYHDDDLDNVDVEF